MNNPVIFCKNVTKTFKDGRLFAEVLKEVIFSLERGEQVAITGPSGSGKSTLLHILGGLDRPTSGQVLISGQDLGQISEKTRCQIRNRDLGFVYQFHHLLPEFTALENVALPLLIQGETRISALKRAEEILDRVGLSARLQHKPAQLSGGERQRVAIARALVTRPKCLLADEPTGNLDEANAEKIYELILHLNRTQATSLVLVTHDNRLTQKMDRVLKLEAGMLHAPQ